MTAWQIPVFGVRHLSPAGAWHLRKYLDEVRPKVVLVEGLADAVDLVPDMTKKATKPPIAILAYTDSLPVRTLVYPLARYSPEYQALQWAKEHDARVEFIDLPSDIFLALQDVEAELHERARRNQLSRRNHWGGTPRVRDGRGRDVDAKQLRPHPSKTQDVPSNDSQSTLHKRCLQGVTLHETVASLQRMLPLSTAFNSFGLPLRLPSIDDKTEIFAKPFARASCDMPAVIRSPR